MNNRNIGVLFDLDGVILDSEGTYTRFWEEIDRLYPTHVDGFAQVIKGSNLHKILHDYFPNDEIRGKVTQLLDSFQEQMRYAFFPHALAWIEQLHEAGVPMCVVTSSDKRKMNAVYAQHPHFKGLFNNVVVGEMVKNPKPDPECFLLGAQLLGVDIKNCYVFEDSLNGLQAGKESGAKVIALATTLPQVTLEGKADLIINNFNGFDLKTMLAL